MEMNPKALIGSQGLWLYDPIWHPHSFEFSPTLLATRAIPQAFHALGIISCGYTGRRDDIGS
jgi:hypothetical protein